MHHYAAALFTVTALPVALILAHEYTEHRKRKAEAAREAQAEAMLTRAIEKGFTAAARRRAAERQAEADRAAHRAQLDAIAAAYHNRPRH